MGLRNCKSCKKITQHIATTIEIFFEMNHIWAWNKLRVQKQTVRHYDKTRTLACLIYKSSSSRWKKRQPNHWTEKASFQQN